MWWGRGLVFDSNTNYGADSDVHVSSVACYWNNQCVVLLDSIHLHVSSLDSAGSEADGIFMSGTGPTLSIVDSSFKYGGYFSGCAQPGVSCNGITAVGGKLIASNLYFEKIVGRALNVLNGTQSTQIMGSHFTGNNVDININAANITIVAIGNVCASVPKNSLVNGTGRPCIQCGLLKTLT
eukprot:TRINITY_DN31727_c0_g1_i1.p1 TRINITY_DN31727_c0_g1~~TRINITY_DN31727_c0_g1_i1.p1  ORF type:complete len:192 (-),score=0.66 TRINITY_DN31727_c0_g1_i1:47-589(-)